MPHGGGLTTTETYYDPGAEAQHQNRRVGQPSVSEPLGRALGASSSVCVVGNPSILGL